MSSDRLTVHLKECLPVHFRYLYGDLQGKKFHGISAQKFVQILRSNLETGSSSSVVVSIRHNRLDDFSWICSEAVPSVRRHPLKPSSGDTGGGNGIHGIIETVLRSSVPSLLESQKVLHVSLRKRLPRAITRRAETASSQSAARGLSLVFSFSVPKQPWWFSPFFSPCQFYTFGRTPVFFPFAFWTSLGSQTNAPDCVAPNGKFIRFWLMQRPCPALWNIAVLGHRGGSSMRGRPGWPVPAWPRSGAAAASISHYLDVFGERHVVSIEALTFLSFC